MTKKIFSSVPSGFEAFVLAREAKQGGIVYIASNEKQLDFVQKTLSLIAPKLKIISYPNWDTVPHDRISPSAERARPRCGHGCETDGCCHRRRRYPSGIRYQDLLQ